MKLLLIIINLIASDLKGYLALGIPTGESRYLLKGGATVGLEATVFKRELISAGPTLEGASFVFLGSGNSEIKLITFAPRISFAPPFLKNTLSLGGRMIFTMFRIQNPSYTDIHYVVGYSLGTAVKILDKPLHLYLITDYSTYPGYNKDFSYFNFGISPGI